MAIATPPMTIPIPLCHPLQFRLAIGLVACVASVDGRRVHGWLFIHYIR